MLLSYIYSEVIPLKKYILVFLLIFLFLLGIIYFYDDGRMKENVYIENIHVGGLKKKTVEMLFAPFISSFAGKINVSAGGVTQIVSYDELELYPDYLLAVEKAYNIGREKSILQRMKSLYEAKKFGVYIKVHWTWNEQKAAQIISRIADMAYYPPKSAEIIIGDNEEIIITESYPGLAVNNEFSLDNADLSQIACGKWQLKTESIPPALSAETAAAWKINGKLASYKTEFNSSQLERTKNITLAASHLKNILLMPGEEFSFNETTGPRTAALGYQQAYIIKNNKFELGIGGGVCQVSSTLYNAVLKAGLPVTERFPHSLPVSYVPEGKDAAVSYGIMDFKFLNELDVPIVIDSKIVANKLQISLFTHLT